ncbi:MAG: 30S ribosomal protein S12 methylthiotransferase RimO [Candidatus Aceula meridiana]|nr:30S ribosomal protein S12 methylthiotransferase RimO [Candidatus Aceula meridiana]
MRSPIFFKKLKPSRIGLINLGCARNLVDSQLILGQLQRKGHQIVDIKKADVAIVNTCAFIGDAKDETIDTILDLVDLKKRGKIQKIAVLGCFAERYPKELAAEFKEVDFINGVLPFERKKISPSVQLTPKSFAYLKICESCYNYCSFCVIPQIKGKFSSRHVESILNEAKTLDQKKIKEINIIGQDITAYGLDIYKEKYLSTLLERIAAQAKNVQWIRLLYSYPAHITDELLNTIKREEKICRYLDLPLQHISDRILKSMNRGLFQKKTIDLIKRIRKIIFGISLRSSFIVGYPGETDKEFKQLCSFVKDFGFDHVGVFTYSKEEGTRAARLPNQVPDDIKQERYAALMEIQQGISRKKLKRFIGKKLKILIDEKERGEKTFYLGRSEFDAPDVDGVVFVRSRRILKPGDFVNATIVDSYEYDLVARC